MKVAALQPGYLPWLGFFEQMNRVDVFVIYDDVQYDKRSWRNRNRIRTQTGWEWLTVPVLVRGKYTQTIKDTRVNNSLPWRRKHLKSLDLNYGKAPSYKEFRPDFADVYEREWEFLTDLDVALSRLIADALGIRTPFVRSSDYDLQGKRTERVVMLLKKLGATYFYNGAAGRAFFEEELFREAGIELHYQDYRHPIYPQLYEPFVPYLSAVDLLFNCGEKSLDVICQGTAHYGTER